MLFLQFFLHAIRSNTVLPHSHLVCFRPDPERCLRVYSPVAVIRHQAFQPVEVAAVVRKVVIINRKRNYSTEIVIPVKFVMIHRKTGSRTFGS